MNKQAKKRLQTDTPKFTIRPVQPRLPSASNYAKTQPHNPTVAIKNSETIDPKRAQNEHFHQSIRRHHEHCISTKPNSERSVSFAQSTTRKPGTIENKHRRQ